MFGEDKKLLYGVSAALFGLLAAMCFFEINSLWLYGHDGFNGSTNAHAARMMLEHDTWGLLKYYYDPGAPHDTSYYTRLPYLPNYMVAALYWLTGNPNSEALARLVPITFSVMSGAAVWWVLRRFWSDTAAVIGLAILILCPVFTVYATMLDHEQGCFFFVVVYLGLYLTWLQDKDWRMFAGILVLATLSVQYDWTGYYVALPVALHAAGYGFWKADEKLSWRPEYTFVAVFSVVAVSLKNGFFYAMGQLTSYDQLRDGLTQRSIWPPGYLALVWKDLEMMYTYPIFGLGVAWLLRMLHRWLTGQARLRDFIPLVFLWAQLFRSLFFSQAGYIHNFWVYYGVGFLAFAGADLLEDLLIGFPEWLHERLDTPRPARLAQALSIALAVGCLGWASADSYKYFFLGHKKGGSLRLHYHDEFNKYVQYAQKVGELRPEGLLVMHNSFWKQHPQTDWYLGYPHIRSIRNGYVPQSYKGVEPTSIVFDIPRTNLHQWLFLMEKHPVTILDNRVVLVDLSVDERRITALRARPIHATPWYRYWTNYFEPPLRWDDDPDTKANIIELYQEKTNLKPLELPPRDSDTSPLLQRLNPNGVPLDNLQRPLNHRPLRDIKDHLDQHGGKQPPP